MLLSIKEQSSANFDNALTTISTNLGKRLYAELVKLKSGKMNITTFPKGAKIYFNYPKNSYMRRENVKYYRIKPNKEEPLPLEDCMSCEYIGDRGVYCNKLGIMRGGLTYCSHYKKEL